jgi:hypothetical protein
MLQDTGIITTTQERDGARSMLTAGRTHVRRGRCGRGPDAALLPHPGSPQLTARDADADPRRSPHSRARPVEGARRSAIGHRPIGSAREIEAAGLDDRRCGTDFALSPAAPARRRGGRSRPLRRLTQRTVATQDSSTGVATVVLIATDWPTDLDRAVRALRATVTRPDVDRGRCGRTVR